MVDLFWNIVECAVGRIGKVDVKILGQGLTGEKVLALLVQHISVFHNISNIISAFL